MLCTVACTRKYYKLYLQPLKKVFFKTKVLTVHLYIAMNKQKRVFAIVLKGLAFYIVIIIIMYRVAQNELGIKT